MLRNIGAVIVGLIVGSAWNMGLITLNTEVLFPMPAGTSMDDPEQYKAYVATLPVAAFMMVIVAHVGQAGIGGWIAARLGKSRPMLLAGIVGLLTLLGSVVLLIALSPPAWTWVEVPLLLGTTWFVGTAETKRRAAAGSASVPEGGS